MTPFVVAANWKMNKSPREAVEFLKDFLSRMERPPQNKQVVFFVPAVDLWVVQQTLNGTDFGWGAQNCHFEKEGAFTGETSPAVLSEIGSHFCLIGHSERRQLFNETDEMITRKLRTLQELQITPMLCLGETLEERESDQTYEVIERQLRGGLRDRIPGRSFYLAYEPVWAIGTGKNASPQQANEAHDFIRQRLIDIVGIDMADKTPLTCWQYFAGSNR